MIIKIGHRGAKGYAPENTLASIEKALEMDIDWVEVDVYKCKTGEIVIVHDNKVDLTTDGRGRVEEKTIQQLKALDAGNGQKIPILEEVLDLVDRKLKVNLELKGEGTAKPVGDIIATYIKEKGWHDEDFIVSSFNHYELQEFKALNPKIKIGAVIAGIPLGYAACAQKLKAYSIHLSKEFINQRLVNDAHRRGLKALVYTVNELEDIQRVKSLGVDGIFSDFPDRL